MSERVLHCWEGGEESTCMLLDGHDGPHVFTPDKDILIAVAPLDEPVRTDT